MESIPGSSGIGDDVEPSPDLAETVADQQHPVNYMEQCLICDKKMTNDNSTIFGEKAKANIIEASKKRKDKKYKIMQSLPQLRLHCNCKIVYVRPNSIEAALKKGKNERTQKRESLKQANTFNFNEACFFL